MKEKKRSGVCFKNIRLLIQSPAKPQDQLSAQVRGQGCEVWEQECSSRGHRDSLNTHWCQKSHTVKPYPVRCDTALLHQHNAVPWVTNLVVGMQ